MEKNWKEYRCECGKLLFKGFLGFSSVETKCLRCGSIKLFQDVGKKSFVSFSVVVDASGEITDACHGISFSGFPREYFIGRDIKEVFPALAKEILGKNQPLKISHNVVFSQSDIENTIESHILSDSEDGKVCRYHIFSKLFRK